MKPLKYPACAVGWVRQGSKKMDELFWAGTRLTMAFRLLLSRRQPAFYRCRFFTRFFLSFVWSCDFLPLKKQQIHSQSGLTFLAPFGLSHQYHSEKINDHTG